MLPSSPPPAPRMPGLRKAGIEPIRLAIRDAVWKWSRERRMSIRDWVVVTCSDATRVDKVLKGLMPWPAEWTAMLPPRDGRELQACIDRAVESLWLRSA